MSSTTSRLMKELRARIDGRPTPGAVPPPAPLVHRPLAPGSRLARDTVRKGDSAARFVLPPPLPVKNAAALAELRRATPALVGVGRAGLRYRTETLLDFLTRFAVAKAAVESQVPAGWAEQHGMLPLETEAETPEQFLARPDLGRKLSAASMRAVAERCAKQPDVQLVVGDGLSANAVMLNAPAMLARLVPELERRGLKVGTLVFVRHARSRLVDVVGQAVGARVGVILIGERPGLGTGDGMSAYLVHDPHVARTDAEKQAVSNIHARGIAPEEAALHAARVIQAILEQRTSGVKLDLTRLESPTAGRAR
ncbi:MAG: ethanolamine ammonia-lyase subunit EutC [Deltaproteobacteria bacterium]|nr:ethanolamine ammonia-lyase subunit EutC [Deltaproteobacteria bacterium]